MPSTVLHKRSDVPGRIPTLASLSAGELAINTSDGKLFIRTVDNQVKEFRNNNQHPYLLNQSLSAVYPQYGNNTVTQVFAGVLGGYNNDISGAGSTAVNGENNDIAGDFAFIGTGLNNIIGIDADYSAILAGKNNQLLHANSFIVGSNITSHLSGFTYVNNLSAVERVAATNIFVNNNLTVTNTVSAKYYQGTLLDWMTLVRGYKTVPTLLQTIAGGDVYTYTYSSSPTDKTYYRYIATDGSEDSFYGSFVSGTLSNLIAKKGIIL